ncbi:hypothetical protein UYA_18255 [Ectopseudomonas alcaliphila JAB1]|nr:hypothetical protein UYA_18255 [Pseudomonas alcaliphila JAB1]
MPRKRKARPPVCIRRTHRQEQIAPQRETSKTIRIKQDRDLGMTVGEHQIASPFSQRYCRIVDVGRQHTRIELSMSLLKMIEQLRQESDRQGMTRHDANEASRHRIVLP